MALAYDAVDCICLVPPFTYAVRSEEKGTDGMLDAESGAMLEHMGARLGFKNFRRHVLAQGAVGTRLQATRPRMSKSSEVGESKCEDCSQTGF